MLRRGILEAIWRSDDIPLIDRLDFMVSVMKSDSSLNAVEYAARYFMIGAKQKNAPLDVDGLLAWWRGHRLEFVGK